MTLSLIEPIASLEINTSVMNEDTTERAGQAEQYFEDKEFDQTTQYTSYFN